MQSDRSILYFVSHPIQYFSPLFRQLSVVTDLDVYYFSDSSIKGGYDSGFGRTTNWDIPLLNGYRHHFLNKKTADAHPDNRFWDLWNPSVWGVVRKSKSRIVIVNGWSYSSNILALLSARLSGKKVWLRAENPLNQELLKSRKTLMVKNIFFKYFFFRLFVDKCLYIGNESRLFFQHYGVPDRKLLFTPYAVDNEHFEKQKLQYKDRLLQIRRELGLPEEGKIILFTGKYISKKRPLDLLKAFHRLPEGKYILVMVGEGDLRPEMEKYIAEHKLKNTFLTGFVNQSTIASYYAMSDVFVMCSGIGETWGLSVNEAMNFEKPVIVSRTCGCASDLVKHGINGFLFQEGDIEELASCIDKVLSEDTFRLSAGKASAEIIRQYSNAVIVQNIMTAINE